MKKEIADYLAKAIAANGYAVSATAEQQLGQYLELLQRWNQVFNLTAIRDVYDMVSLHILDSLSIAPAIQGKRVLDVGTGAGLPGIPLALTQRDKHFVLLDSNNKKTRFLTQVKLEVGISNIDVVQARCETYEVAPTERFDCIVSRAFSSIAVMLSGTDHLLADGGVFVAMKGVHPASELQDLPDGFTVTDIHKLDINGLAAERHVVCIKRK